MDKKTNIKAYSAAIFFSVLVGFSFLGIKTCVPLANSLQILVHRYNFAFLALLLLLALRIARLDLRGKPKKNLILTAGFYVGFMVLQVIGLYFSSSIEGSIIFAIVPIIAQIIASVFFGRKSDCLAERFCLPQCCLSNHHDHSGQFQCRVPHQRNYPSDFVQYIHGCQQCVYALCKGPVQTD